MSNKRPKPTLRTGSEKWRKSSQKTNPDHRKLPPFSDKHSDDWRFAEYMEHDHRDLPSGELSDGRRKSLEFVIEPDNKQPVIWESNSSRTNKIKGGEGSGPYVIEERITHGRQRKVVIHGDMIKSKVKLTDLMPIGSKGEQDRVVFNSSTRVGHESDALARQSEDELDEEEVPTPKPASGGTLPPTPKQASRRTIPPTPKQASGGALPSTPKQASGRTIPPTPKLASGGTLPPTPKQASGRTIPPTPKQAGGGTLPPIPKQASGGTLPDSWYDNYKKMNNKDKWVLASGRRVENVILEACEKMGSKEFASSPARLFILDTSDPVVERWFRNDEWKEIKSKLSPLPGADEALVDSLAAFYSVKTTTMVREILTSGLIPGDVTYDKNLHFNLQWAEMVLLKFLVLLEAHSEPLILPHNEGWYGFNIWSPILDAGLLDLQGLTLERKDNSCPATAQPRSHQRDEPTGRVKLGHHLDGIICTLGGGYHEFGGIQHGATFEGGVIAEKWQSDQFKLIECMRDMFKRLDDLVNSDPTIKRRMKIVGISTAELALQYTLLGHPGHGHVYLLQKGEVALVPTTAARLPDLLRILVIVAQLKQVIKVSFEAVNERDPVQSEENFYQELVGGNSSSGSGTKLGWSAPSP
ncbi:hypothetical protein HOY82DRAFT_641540 [Tuber indicum]|nr:hypothetical protein HOY82DRAFT_641540 [Tuber indicum]